MIAAALALPFDHIDIGAALIFAGYAALIVFAGYVVVEAFRR